MPDLAKQFTKEEIINAIEHLEKNNINLKGSTVHDLFYNGKRYPPKEVVRWAARLKQIPNWESYRLSGGENTNKPLRKLGFTIIEKNDVPNSIQKLINDYKKTIKRTKLENEIYKWELVQKFQGRPNLEVSDLADEINSLDFGNLVYNLAKATIKHLAKDKTEEYRIALQYLFNENVELETRIPEFRELILKIYRELVPENHLAPHHDERTIATFLTFLNPAKYTFYMSGIYKAYCDYLGIKTKKKNQKYIHYLELINELIENYLKNDSELIELVNSYKTDKSFADENLMILAQDILFKLTSSEKYSGQEKIIQDFEDWHLERFNEEINEPYLTSVIALLFHIEQNQILNNEQLENYNSEILSIIKDEIQNYRYEGLHLFEQFLDELLFQNIKPMKQPLNQILYGPPGTGKTYYTINKAIQIINPEFDFNKSRSEFKEEFDRLVNNGKIQFVTFHQSMSYEDFVEGIKPYVEESNDENSSQVLYEVRDGILKELSKKASFQDYNVQNQVEWRKVDYYKLSLGGKQRPDIHNFCIENNLIAIWYGGNKDLKSLSEIKSWEEFKLKFQELNPNEVEQTKYHIQAAFQFLKMKKGDIVVISRGNHVIDAIGVVDGDYFFEENASIEYVHFRPVKWLATNMNFKPEFFLNKVNISQMTIYEFYKKNVKYEAFEEMFGSSQVSPTKLKNHVLIIDEINRGNVSQIFGELITLIEEDKRIGNSEELYVTLPYSKEKFGVPSNLYIIGTMNTADRSVEALDTALRRRFSFEEMTPKYDLDELKQSIFGFSAGEILKTINARIEQLIDRDHAIGHAYFINKTEETIVDSFYRNIIPLLQEYFFGDYGKIGLVLGAGFVRLKQENVKFAHFSYDGYDSSDQRDTYEIIDYRKESIPNLDFSKAIKLLMNQSVE